VSVETIYVKQLHVREKQ